jgi:NAD(P)-dependent dehydrogenase (short-subunit alcohol dehydrogenase family)
MRVLITGANSGIGKEAAVKYAENNYEVIMFCRNREKGESVKAAIIRKTGNEAISLIICDMSSQKSIRSAVDTIISQYDSIDVLINNAANFDLTISEAVTTAEGFEQIWATNHLGPYLLSHLLVDLLKKGDGKRIINICSKGILAFPFIKIYFEDPGFLKSSKFSVAKAYYQSKLAQEMTTVSLSDKLRDSQITVSAIKVPAVKVDVSRLPDLSKFKLKIYKMKMKNSLEPSRMAETYFWLGNSEEAKMMNGKIINENNKEVKFASVVYKIENRRKLVELSNKQTGLS